MIAENVLDGRQIRRRARRNDVQPAHVSLGFTKVEVANIGKAYGFVANLAGLAAGGVVVLRFGIFRALLVCGVLQMLSNLMYVLQAWVGHDVPTLALTIGVENLTGGMGSAAFVAYLSGLCNIAFTATQYALLTSLAAVGRTTLSASGGALADALGWGPFFVSQPLPACRDFFSSSGSCGRSRPRDRRSAVGEQPAAMPFEPCPRCRAAGGQALHQAPKARPVVHLREMRHLMRDDIVDDRFGRKNEPPAEREITPAGTASPSAFRITYPDPRQLASDPRREGPRPVGEFGARHSEGGDHGRGA